MMIQALKGQPVLQIPEANALRGSSPNEQEELYPEKAPSRKITTGSSLGQLRFSYMFRRFCIGML